jgi:flagellar basal-body rod protein FlgG
MTSTALSTAATGMSVAQTDIDLKAHNIANIRTGGFKKFRVETADLTYKNLRMAGVSETADIDIRPVGIQIGLGAKVIGAYRILEQGNIENTGNPLDLAILEGAGYFQINVPRAPNGVAYTRNGSFIKNSAGNLTTSEGYELAGGINIPINVPVNTIQISADGVVTGKDANNAGQIVTLGQIELFTFTNEQGLEAYSSNLLIETAASGPAVGQVPGDGGTGTLRQKAREESNVDPTTELTSLIMAQRAYELNAKVIKAADEAMKTVADITP